MNIILFLTSMLLPTFAGYVVLYKEDSLTFMERAVFAFTLGTGLLSFYLFLLTTAGLSFSFITLAPFFLPFFIVGILKWRQMIGNISISWGSPLSELTVYRRALFMLLFSLIVLKCLYILFMIYSVPVTFWDAYTVWNFKAKVIYYTNSIAAGTKEAGLLEGPQRNYPLNLPMMRAWIAFVIGRWSEPFVNLHSLILFICLLVIVFETLRKVSGKLPAMIAAYVIASIPLFLLNTIGGYADMAIGYYFLAGNIMLLNWHRTKRKRFLIFTGIIAAVAMFTKNEGVGAVFPALFLTFLFYLLYARHSWKHIAGYVALFLASSVLILFWLHVSQSLSVVMRILDINNGQFVFHGYAIRPLLKHLFNSGNYNLYWSGIILIFLLKRRRILETEAKFFLVPSLLMLGAILYVFLMTDSVKWLLNSTTINRSMLLVIPSLTVSAGLLFTRNEE